MLDAPYGDELPAKGFDPGVDTYQAPPGDGSSLKVSTGVTATAPFVET